MVTGLGVPVYTWDYAKAATMGRKHQPKPRRACRVHVGAVWRAIRPLEGATSDFGPRRAGHVSAADSNWHIICH